MFTVTKHLCESTQPATREERKRSKEERKERGGRGSYLGLHGSVHGRRLVGGAAVGERFRGAGRQRGLLGGRGGLRGALDVLTVALVSLGGGQVQEREGVRTREGDGGFKMKQEACFKQIHPWKHQERSLFVC